ncbi:hypothetical protein WAK64_11725 [Bacillus spongiae]|uniref:Bacteriocin immunity protein n=1 Tax=Bacillus spongiae TaxID=2683610 RepID=A0ABU8HEZ5_9BACI
MEKIKLQDLDQDKIDQLKASVKNNTYTDDDFKVLFEIFKKYDNDINLYQTKKICEFVQYLHAVRREDRLESVLIQFIENMVPQRSHNQLMANSFSYIIGA